MSMYHQQDEQVDAIQLKGPMFFTPVGEQQQFGVAGDYFIQREDGRQQIMKRCEFEDRFGRHDVPPTGLVDEFPKKKRAPRRRTKKK